MKKIISFLMCAVMILSSFCIEAYAADGKFIKETVGFFEKTGGNIVSITSRIWNKIIRTDETDIPYGKETKSSRRDFDGEIEFDAEKTYNTENWRMLEITFESEKIYENPFDEVEMNLHLYGNGKEYVVPSFWDGGSVWKVRLACPETGVWNYITECSDSGNASLHNRTGKIISSEYSGNMDIYKHGFIKTEPDKKYFVYDDETPFFYLGDTHWSLGDETVDMVKTICAHRAAQNFTVIQSEPIGAGFQLHDGLTQADIEGFRDYDKKFDIIAQNGLVHANAEFFFPVFMEYLISNFGGYSNNKITVKKGLKKESRYDIADSVKEYLRKISRYWVARYTAYPVIWTLGQEVDGDFYHSDTNHADWNYINNPYKYVADFISEYDPYSHPLSAHQENTGATSAYGSGKGASDKQKVYLGKARPSIFRDFDAHTFYAAQWSNPPKTGRSDYKVEKDYWYNSQGKPVVNYEGLYCYLWTKNFGSRMQGWAAYLNGMYGYGWGGHDTWSYLNVYDEENDSSDGLDTITSEEKKKATWQDSLEYASSYQNGYMHSFFSNMKWYELVPRFNNKSYFAPLSKVYSITASNKDNTEMVIYFYSFHDSSVAAKNNSTASGGRKTGTIGNLIPGETYRYKWFNPITGEYSEEGSFKASCFGTYYIGNKKWNGEEVSCDMVFYMYR